jgi:hypothetical protein
VDEREEMKLTVPLIPALDIVILDMCSTVVPKETRPNVPDITQSSAMLVFS